MSSQNFIISAQPAQVIVPAASSPVPVIAAGVQGPAGASETYRQRLKINMSAGVVTYGLPSIPATSEVLVLINGVGTAHTINGVNLTITGLTPGSIEDTDELQVFY